MPAVLVRAFTAKVVLIKAFTAKDARELQFPNIVAPSKQLMRVPLLENWMNCSSFASFASFAVQAFASLGPHSGNAMQYADGFDLDRFVQAQNGVYASALAELQNGEKRTHWMWYVFPQLAGLGQSSTARKYAIANLAEAEAYLRHPVLGPRLVECAEAVLAVTGRSAPEIFGTPDDMKLRSCATLFAWVSAPGSVFHRILDKYFGGEGDAP